MPGFLGQSTRRLVHEPTGQNVLRIVPHPILNGILISYIFTYILLIVRIQGPHVTSMAWPSLVLHPSLTAQKTQLSPHLKTASFKLADSLFTRNQILGVQIDILLDIWAAKEDDPLFTNHSNLYQTIDSINVGDAPWQSLSVSYDGPRPDGDLEAPSRMDKVFEVWHRDPRLSWKISLRIRISKGKCIMCRFRNSLVLASVNGRTLCQATGPGSKR